MTPPPRLVPSFQFLFGLLNVLFTCICHSDSEGCMFKVEEYGKSVFIWQVLHLVRGNGTCSIQVSLNNGET
jgi:hypothetical protein